jgi:lipid-A-disaccharide synthase
MRAAGVRPVIESESLSVVGLVEVAIHLPRIYRQFRRLVQAAAVEKPDFAILTDSPDFHLRLARKLKRLGIPVVYLVAPQAWAWRPGRVRIIRETVRRLLCIFPFEEPFFLRHGVSATYIGHPLARLIHPSTTKAQFFQQNSIPDDRPLIALLPGSRPGEIARHVSPLADAVTILRREMPCTFIAGAPLGFSRTVRPESFWERFRALSIKILEGSTWDLLAHADLALAASGTVTIEAAFLGAPMVTFYRVSSASWAIGRWMVRVPFLSMVNLVAGRAIVPELMQDDVTGEHLASEARKLLANPSARNEMRTRLAEVRTALTPAEDPMDAASGIIESIIEKETVDVS